MNLSDLFNDLALSELKNLAMSADGGTISPKKRPEITNYANEGLLALYSRYVLKEKDMIIEMREGMTNYHLLRRYANSQYNEENPPDRWNMPYIMDAIHEPFEEDVIKILGVWNSYGDKLPLNDTENTLSVFSPQSNVLQVPFPIPGQALAIEYQAKHAKLDECECDAIIELPDVLWRALKAYIAWKTFMHMNTQENTIKGQEHATNFEMICSEVVERDLVSSSSSFTNTRFCKRGWI